MHARSRHYGVLASRARAILPTLLYTFMLVVGAPDSQGVGWQSVTLRLAQSTGPKFSVSDLAHCQPELPTAFRLPYPLGSCIANVRARRILSGSACLAQFGLLRVARAPFCLHLDARLARPRRAITS